MSRETRAAEITAAQVEQIIGLLSEGRTLNRACKAADVPVRDFRWLRHASGKINRRVNEARVRGLLDRARTLREVAAQLEARADKIMC